MVPSRDVETALFSGRRISGVQGWAVPMSGGCAWQSHRLQVSVRQRDRNQERFAIGRSPHAWPRWGKRQICVAATGLAH